MALYYDGDLEKDLERVKNEPFWLGYHAGLDKARKEALCVVAINAVTWIAFGFMLHGG